VVASAGNSLSSTAKKKKNAYLEELEITVLNFSSFGFH
jgi:hypothetical protein